ncbi:nucleotide sugar dehydrogenase [Pseudohalioglobus lutimaris]|uniref:UDP-glucose 6-dehydrogenase n=1 Tax=Pseudohalioglobus lutimaris TaxID=1737061 RepID=A0A2N5WWL8_9GAMM|nr:UDP-glucose/GDP-mannose dehydrogenase family protein [Pseudohalioglobus lutimaris]PLW66637.1 GDP-mannose dehydrogenase [Pseudohalioglobus lutimaris]
MKISIFGLGYVGVVSAACLGSDGHSVVGVDPNTSKVDMVNAGKAPIIEEGLGGLLESGVQAGFISATSDAEAAVLCTNVSFICVGTPSQSNGSLDLTYVRRVCEEIGKAIKLKQEFHVVVARSTMLPGSMKDTVLPILEKTSGKIAGKDFGVCINPEFLREGTAIEDYRNPPKTVIGEMDERSGDLLGELYSELNAPLVRTDLATAEMVKYTDNIWHALKVGFANEIGNVCKHAGIDGHRVMEIFCADEKLNLSSAYLKPGFAFGGSCLPKDIRAISYKAKSMDVELPIIDSILPSNQKQIERGLDMILSTGNKKISILGFSFKAGTDDLRESPLVEVIERLIGKGYDLRLYDRNVNLARLTGANKEYIHNVIPHISQLMVDNLEEVLEHGDTIVIGNRATEFKQALAMTSNNQSIIDLVRISEETSNKDKYNGICW